MRVGIGKYRKRRVGGALVPLVLGLVAAWIHPSLDALERRTWDIRFVRRGARATSGRVALVEIDERTADYPPWQDDPMILWGPHYAAVVRRLKAAGARVIGFDLVQRVSAHRIAADADRQFAVALAEAGNVVLVILRDRRGLVTPAPQILYGNGEENVGVANFVEGDGRRSRDESATARSADPDGVVRACKLQWEGAARAIPSFALRLLERHVGASAQRVGPREVRVGDTRIPLHHDGTLLINYVGPRTSGPGDPLPAFSFHDIAEGRMPRGFDFRGKVVLIGASYVSSQDLHLTPYSRDAGADEQYTPGVEVWANAVLTLLDRRFLSTTEPAFGRALLVALAMATGAIFLGTGLGWGLVACAGAMAAWFGVCEWLFRTRDYLLLMFTPLVLIPVNYSAVTAYRFFAEESEKLRIKRMWGRYLSREVVEYLLQHPEEEGLGGRRTRVTVLFSDIRGFTALSESLPPTEVVRMLNEYLTAMAGAVTANGGLVDKYVGDAVMAVWGVPRPCADGPRRAVRTALRMMEELERLNARWDAEGRGRLEVGVGINTGEAVSGNIGSPEKMDFTVIGDTVNVASRLEGLTKDRELGARVVIGEETARLLGDEFLLERLPPAAIRNRDEPVVAYSVVGVRESAGTGHFCGGATGKPETQSVGRRA